MPVIEGLAGGRPDLRRYISGIDRRGCPVAGAALVNDISGLRYDPALAGVVATSGARSC